MAVSFTTAACTETKVATETVTVTDMLGETITVKKNPKKVACASRTTYDLLIAFGLGDCIEAHITHYSKTNGRRFLMKKQTKDIRLLMKKVMKRILHATSI